MPRGGKRPGTGGARPGAGRPRGSKNRRTAELTARARLDGELPHEFLRRVALGGLVDDHEVTFAERTLAAEKAAPYYAPKLASVDHRHTIDTTKLTDDQLAELERVRLLLAVAGGDQDGAAPEGGTEAPPDHRTKH